MSVGVIKNRESFKLEAKNQRTPNIPNKYQYFVYVIVYDKLIDRINGFGKSYCRKALNLQHKTQR